jgi:hypothetical protein
MRIFLIFLINCLIIGNLYSEPFRETFLIRRMFLDTINRSPTPQEIDWFCEYNTKPYERAVQYIIEECKDVWVSELDMSYLLSIEYKNKPLMLLTKQEKIEIIFYLNGFDKNTQQTPENIHKCYDRMIEYAVSSTFNITDAFDYVANLLLCRLTTLQEINDIIKIYNSTENQQWYAVIDYILNLDDFKLK